MKILKKILSFLPLVLMSLLLSLVVWFLAVNANDPIEEVTYSKPIPIEVLGQNPQYTITDQSASNVTVTVKAPRSVHKTLGNDLKLIRATVNISALREGQSELEPEIRIDVKPTKLVDFNPKVVRFSLEKLVSQSFDVTLNQTGNLPMGLEARPARLDISDVQVTGAESKVQQVTEILATIDMSTVTGDVTKQVELQAVDEQRNIVEGISISPARVTVTIPVLQLGGYKNAFLVLIPLGTPAYGFQITNSEITPQFVTIYAKDPSLRSSLPDFIETKPVNLNGRDTSFEEVVELNLPEGVEVVTEVEVVVKVDIEAIITTKSVRGIPVTVSNVPQGLKAVLSASSVDVYLTGPTAILAELNEQTLTVVMDMTDKRPGTYQVKPTIVLPDQTIDYHIVPEVIEVYLQPK